MNEHNIMTVAVPKEGYDCVKCISNKVPSLSPDTSWSMGSYMLCL